MHPSIGEWHYMEQQRQHAAWLASLTPEQRALEADLARSAERERKRRREAELEAQAQQQRKAAEWEEWLEGTLQREHASSIEMYKRWVPAADRAELEAEFELDLATAGLHVHDSLFSEHNPISQLLFLAAIGAIVLGPVITHSETGAWIGALLLPAVLLAWEIRRQLRHRQRSRAAKRAKALGERLHCGQWPCKRCGTTLPEHWPPERL
jgi:rubrerythrin